MDDRLESRQSIEARLDTDLNNVFPDDSATGTARLPEAPPGAYSDWTAVGGGGRGGVQVKDPRGVVHTFPDPQSAEAFKRVDKVAMDMDWDVVARAPAEGRLEAVATSAWFGFNDDIVVRIKPDGSGSRVDIRSKSRVGESDLGVNARRIREFIVRLKAEG